MESVVIICPIGPVSIHFPCSCRAPALTAGIVIIHANIMSYKAVQFATAGTGPEAVGPLAIKATIEAEVGKFTHGRRGLVNYASRAVVVARTLTSQLKFVLVLLIVHQVVGAAMMMVSSCVSKESGVSPS